MAAAPNLPSPKHYANSTTASAAAACQPFTTTSISSANSPSRPQAPHPSFPLYHYYASQNIPVRSQIQTKSHSLNSSPSSHQQQQGILYPVASSGRGFIPRPVRPLDHAVTLSNLPNLAPAVYNPCSAGVHRPAIASGSGSVTACPSAHPHLDSGVSHRSRPSYFNHQHPVHLIRKHPTPLQHHQQQPPVVEQYLAGSVPMIKGIPFTGQLKVSSSPLPVSDSNDHKDLRDRSRDDTLTVAMIRDRKVRILEDASLYALCRSWLRNGFPEENQPHFRDIVKVLPEPLPLFDVEIHSQKMEDEEEDKKDEESVDDLSPQDLLRRHIKRAKKVRARLREGRLKRIARFKTRLAMLLPPQVEQFRNGIVAGK